MKILINPIALTVAALADLAVLKFSFLGSSKKDGFAFIIHPRTEADTRRKYGVAKLLGRRVTSVWNKTFWPIRASRVTGVKSLKDGRDLDGWVVICPLTAKQLVNNRELALTRIKQTITLAERYGAGIVGLGGLTSSVTKGGLDLVEHTKAGLATGRALTPLIVSQFALDGVQLAGWDLAKINIAVIGAAGSIGGGSALLLVRAGARKIILIDLERKRDRLLEVEKKLHAVAKEIDVTISHDISVIRQTNLIITATSATEALITSAHISPKTLIVDDAQPSDVHGDVLARSDVVTVQGGAVKTPGIMTHFPMGFSEKDENFSCFAEVVTLAAHGRFDDFSVGYVKEEEIEGIEGLAKDLGIRRGNFQNHLKVYTEDEVRAILS